MGALGNPMYGVPGAIVTDNGLLPPEGVGRVRSDSMYMTIPTVENGHSPTTEGPQICKVGPLTGTQPMEVARAGCSGTLSCEVGAESVSVSVGYSRISSAAQCMLLVHAGPTGSGNHRKESGDLQRSVDVPTSGGKKLAQRNSAAEHAKESAAAVTPQNEAPGGQKATRGRQTATERAGDNTTEHSSLQVPPSKAALKEGDGTEDPEENYATISDIIGDEDEEEGEDPYCLVGPSSENNSISSGIFAKEQRRAEGCSSPLDHFHSMYALLGATSLEDLHERNQVGIQRMKATTTKRRRGGSVGAGNDQQELGGSFTLFTDNPCHDKDMDRLSYKGDTHDGSHLGPSVPAGQRRPSMALPQITVATNQSDITAMSSSSSHQCLPLITIQATTPQQDAGVTITVGNPATPQGQGTEGNGFLLPNRCTTGDSNLPHLQSERNTYK